MYEKLSKGNIRSFRYSDKVADILNRQKGTSLNDKFEQLILHCFTKLPELDAVIESRQKQLASLEDRLSAARKELLEYESLIRVKNDLSKQITQLAVFSCGYKEKVTQLVSAASSDRNAAVE